MDDFLNRSIGAEAGDLEPTVGSVLGIGLGAAVGEGTHSRLKEEQIEEGDRSAFSGET